MLECESYWSTHTKPSHTRVNSPHFWSTHSIYEINRVATQSGNQGKQGKWSKQIPCREKSGNFKIKKKSGNYQGILQNVKKRNV